MLVSLPYATNFITTLDSDTLSQRKSAAVTVTAISILNASLEGQYYLSIPKDNIDLYKNHA